MVAARGPRRRPAAVAVPPPETGPYAAVWRRLRRLPLDDRNAIATVELDTATGSIPIRCGADPTRPHHATVDADGRLVLADHDVDAELAMLALGAALPLCLLHLAVWHHATTDPAFLLAWGDDGDGDGLRAAREDWEGNYWESWPAEPPAARALFGPRLQLALAMAAARRAASGDDGEAWRALQRATQLRARRSFVTSLAVVDAHPRPDALVPVRIRVDRSPGAGAGAGAGTVSGRLARLGSAVHLVLPADWLWTVWLPRLDVVGDRFVLAATDSGVESVRWRPSGGPDGEHVPEVVAVRGP